MRIGIIGGGVVGSALAKSLSEFCPVSLFDVDPKRSAGSEEEAVSADLCFVCLPTPKRKDAAGLDTRVLDGFFKRYEGTAGKRQFVVRSTVPIGYTRSVVERFKVTALHSPEFLTARCSFLDAQIPNRNIVGTPLFDGAGHGHLDAAATALSNLYVGRWPHVLLMPLSSCESEAVKLLTNTFFAIKVAAFNELKTICDAKGLLWETVLRTMLLDGRISPSHTQVPGPDGKPGFGGECLPKDADEVLKTLTEFDLPSMMTMGAIYRNVLDRQGAIDLHKHALTKHEANPTSGEGLGQSSSDKD